MDPFNGCSKSKLPVKELVSLKHKIKFDYNFFLIFVIQVYYFDQSSAPLIDHHLKQLNPLCIAYLCLIFHRVN